MQIGHPSAVMDARRFRERAVSEGPRLGVPFFGILLSPIFAAAAMSLSSVSVIVNALRLRVVKLGPK